MDSPREDLRPGIRRVDDHEAEELVADLTAGAAVECETSAAVDALLAERLGAVTDGERQALRSLAARAQRALGVVERTRLRAVADAGARLAGGTAVAVHPDTVRARAEDVVRAREALVAAERAVAQQQVDDDEPSAPRPAPDGGSAPDAVLQLRARRNQAVGLVIASFGLALLLFVLGVLPLWGALLVPFVTSIVAMRLLSGGRRDADDEPPSSMLAEVDRFTAATPRAAPAPERSQERQRLEARRALAEEDLRVAERAWQDLAGPDADVDDLEAVVRRFDPQQEAAEEVAAASMSVRAVEAAAARAVDAWQARWQDLGRPAPELEDDAVDAALAELPGRADDQLVVVLRHGAGERAAEVAERLPAATVLVVGAPALSAEDAAPS